MIAGTIASAAMLALWFGFVSEIYIAQFLAEAATGIAREVAFNCLEGSHTEAQRHRGSSIRRVALR
jgi:hypothetical protein